MQQSKGEQKWSYRCRTSHPERSACLSFWKCQGERRWRSLGWLWAIPKSIRRIIFNLKIKFPRFTKIVVFNLNTIFLGRGFFILMIHFFNQLLRYHIFPTRWFSTTYCDQTNIKNGIRISAVSTTYFGYHNFLISLCMYIFFRYRYIQWNNRDGQYTL